MSEKERLTTRISKENFEFLKIYSAINNIKMQDLLDKIIDAEREKHKDLLMKIK